MLDPNLITTINEVRTGYLAVVEDLLTVASFKALLASSQSLKDDWKECRRVAASPRVQTAARVAFSCAFVGSSGHGKTTVLAEMFPDLERRNWLRTDVTDTTSQALIIRHAPPDSNDANRVIVRSWGIDEIRRLVDAAKAENARDNVVVRAHEDHIEVDGTDSNFPRDDVRRFKFGLEQELRPIPSELVLTPEQVADPAFINALTTKETSDRIRKAPVLTVGGRAFEPLPLRAAIKEVELREPYSQILRWAGPHAAEAAELVFIDTPGLNVAGTAKDEVLRHVLSKKNQQIIVELIRNDDLDVIIHLVLNGGQSAFSQLWSAVADQCSAEDLADLEDRLVLAINGVNLYFTNDDLMRKWKNPEAAQREGDHFAVTLEDNVLNRISDRGRVRPAKVCFLDSRRIVKDYAEAYARHRELLEQWCSPGAVGHETLRRLGLVEALRRNVEPLCDPADRGQGHLVRLVLELLREKGNRLFVRKHLIRNKLLAAIHRLHEALRRNYDDSGTLNFQAIQKSIRQCLAGIDLSDPGSIESFAHKHLDSLVEQVVPALDAVVTKENWVNACFNKFASLCYQAMTHRLRNTSREMAGLFATYFQERANHWRQAWGYAGARMPPPTRKEPDSAELLRHVLKLHAREMLYQLVSDQAGGVGHIPQSDQDQETMRHVLATLGRLERQASELCLQHGESPL